MRFVGISFVYIVVKCIKSKAMRTEKYNGLYLYKHDETIYPNVSYFEVGDIFEIITIWNGITYAKVIDEWKQLFYDIDECTAYGLPVPNALRVNMVTNSAILRMIKQRNWRLYKKAAETDIEENNYYNFSVPLLPNGRYY